VEQRSSEEPGEAKEASPAPPLPNEPTPGQADDGWEFHWRPEHNAYAFYNRITQKWQWENPRVSSEGTAASTTAPGVTSASGVAAVSGPPPLPGGGAPSAAAGGYNPAIHGDYDPTAWYAQPANTASIADIDQPPPNVADYDSGGFFNRVTGQWQKDGENSERHSDEAKSRRQMNAYFDVDAAANSHEGRSLKAERSGKKPSKSELKAFKEKRRAKKEEKRRAWLRD
jgi:hypothetical protein